MKKTLNNLKQWVTIWIWIVFTLWISGLAYWALSSLTATDSETLTATKWNALVEHAVPSWAVMSFNLASCPTGWSEYTLAYGRFIRWIDKSWTNIDPDGQRALWNIQNEELKSHSHTFNRIANTAWSTAWILYDNMWWSANYVSNQSPWINANWWSETRPKNISLLYCIKD